MIRHYSRIVKGISAGRGGEISFLFALIAILALGSVVGFHGAFASSPTLTLSPTSGPPSSMVTLSGSGYAHKTAYSYCFSTSDSSTSACVSGTSGTFTTDPMGNIPGGPQTPTVTVPSGTAVGSYYVIVYSGSSVASYAAFTVTSTYAGCSFPSSTSSLQVTVCWVGSGPASDGEVHDYLPITDSATVSVPLKVGCVTATGSNPSSDTSSVCITSLSPLTLTVANNASGMQSGDIVEVLVVAPSGYTLSLTSFCATVKDNPNPPCANYSSSLPSSSQFNSNSNVNSGKNNFEGNDMDTNDYSTVVISLSPTSSVPEFSGSPIIVMAVAVGMLMVFRKLKLVRMPLSVRMAGQS
jgi:hypothetical protein